MQNPLNFTCTSENLIYAIVCQRCSKIYIGETKNSLAIRFSAHRRSIENNEPGYPVATHFNSEPHTLNDVKVTCVLSTAGNSDKHRHTAEQSLIHKLNTMKPHGLNTRFDLFKCDWLNL